MRSLGPHEYTATTGASDLATSTSRSFWAGVAATFVAFFLVKAAWPILSDVLRDNDYRVEREMSSPGGTRRAVLYTGMGGGAAGWCAQCIAVAPSKEPFTQHMPIKQWRTSSLEVVTARSPL